MLSRFSDVLQTAADVLAPPATRLEDFEYHWKMVVNFYQNYDESSKVHIEDTRVPHHLHRMLQLIVEEEKEQQGGTVGPCLEAVIKRSVGILDALSLLVAVDRPPGARCSALTLATSLLRRTKSPCLNSPHVYRPLQRMLLICNESPASPTEKEEVELLLTLCGLVRKEPGLANIFTTPFVEDTASLLMIPEDIKTLIPIKSKVQTPKKNPLFDVDMVSNPLRTVSIVRVNKDDNCIQLSSSVGDDNASSKSHKTVNEDNDKFLLIDLLLSYLDSADNQVVLRACEGVLIVSSLAEDDIAALLTGGSPACERLAARLLRRYRDLPPDLDPAAVEQLSITWAYVAQDFGDKNYNNFYGYRELTAFFSWLDYIDTLMKECHPIIAVHLSRAFRTQFLEPAAEALGEPRSAILATAVLAKCLRVLDSQDLINEFSSWLAGEGEGGADEWGQLRALTLHCLRGDHDLTLETLRFFEAVIEKGTEHSIDRLVLSRVCGRAYRCERALQDERDRLNDLSHARERERARESLTTDERAGGLLAHADDNIHRVVNRRLKQLKERIEEIMATDNSIAGNITTFLLLLPRGVQAQPLADCEHYVHDAQRHHQLWLDITATYNWPTEVTVADNTASSTHSYDSRPEADIHLDDAFETVHAEYKRRSDIAGNDRTDKSDVERERYRSKPEGCPFSQALVRRHGDATTTSDDDFDEGPFLKMLFKLLSTMPDQPYQVNLHLTSIISKLALLPHPNLHEYLLNPDLPTAKTTPTLFKTLQEVARRLTMEVPRIKNYKKVIETTRLQLMSEDPSYDEIGSHNQLVESLIVLEEFCKELAAIAFVKHQHQLQQQSHQHQR